MSHNHMFSNNEFLNNKSKMYLRKQNALKNVQVITKYN